MAGHDARAFNLTASGSIVEMSLKGIDRHPDRDSDRYIYSVQSPRGVAEEVTVLLLSPGLMNVALQQSVQRTYDSVARQIADLAVIHRSDAIESVPTGSEGGRQIVVDVGDAEHILRRVKQGDREIRRFLARLLYEGYLRGTLREATNVSAVDLALLGVSLRDIQRSAQLLEDEGYLRIGSTSTNTIDLLPTAKLIRDVEKYGSAKDDALSQPDFLATTAAYSALDQHRPTVEMEYRRYSTASTMIELESVFRAIAPVVEGVVKELLRAHGSTLSHGTLGPAIAEMTSRKLGGIALSSQLNHILKFARDLSQHGAALPISVVRIACENAFELLPQLAALFPAALTPPPNTLTRQSG